MTAKMIAYWVTTGLLAAGMISGGVAELTRRPETIESMVQLGYPAYFIMIIGVWKVLGSLVLLAPGLPRAKEWAYAGFFFNMTGAFISHLVSGSAAWHLVVTGAFVLLIVASWALRPQSRVLGTLFPARLRRQSRPAAGADGVAGMAIAPTRGA